MSQEYESALSSIWRADEANAIACIETMKNIDEVDDDYKMTLLNQAVIGGLLKVVNVLINKGANVNIRDRYGFTALNYAVQNYNVEAAKILIDNGADVHSKDKWGNNIINKATFESKGRGEIIKLLLAAGANPYEENDHGVNAIKLAETIGNYDVKQFFNNMLDQY